VRSQRITWDDVAASEPEMIIVGPAIRPEGSDRGSEASAGEITDAEVYAVDANAYFARPPPGSEGVELLAHLFHPDRFTWPHQHRRGERRVTLCPLKLRIRYAAACSPLIG